MTIKAIQQKCEQCGLIRCYDWEQGFNRSENLARLGWQRVGTQWICPDCVTEVRGRE